MYIYNIDYANEVIVRSDNYPKTHYLTKRNEETGVLEPDKVEEIDLVPVAGRKITVSVAENGFIVTRNKETHVVENGAFGKSLYETVDELLKEEVTTYRDYVENELEDIDFIKAMEDLNSQ